MKASTKKGLTTLAILVVFLVCLKFLPLKEWLEPVWHFIEDAGPMGYLYFVLLGVVLSLVMLPISPVIIASGLLFGFWGGLGMSAIVLLVSSGIGYQVGSMFWPKLEHYSMFQNKWFKAVRKAIEQEGVYLVGLFRLTPFIHYTVGNAFYGSLNLRFWAFLGVSLLGMLPGTAVLVYAGYLAQRSFSQDVELNGWHIALFATGIIVFAGITMLVTKKTRRILEEGQV